MLKSLERALRRKVFKRRQYAQQALVAQQALQAEEPNSLGAAVPALKEGSAPINRIPNPWGPLQAYKVVDARQPIGDLRADYLRYGVVLIKNLLSLDEVSAYMQIVREVSGLDESDYLPVVRNEKKAYVSPGTLNRTPALWPLAVHPTLVQVLSSVLDEPQPRYVGSDSLFVHYSSVGFHRDTDVMESSNPWSQREFKYTHLKVMFYLNGEGRQVNRLGIQPFSHLAEPVQPPGWTRSQEDLEKFPIWVDIGPTDCLLFDPRLKHSGDVLNAPKFALTFAYSADNDYTLEFVMNSRTVGQLEGYDEYAPEFVDFLKQHQVWLTGMDDSARYREYTERNREQIRARIHWLAENQKITEARRQQFLQRLDAGEPLRPPGEPRDIICF